MTVESTSLQVAGPPPFGTAPSRSSCFRRLGLEVDVVKLWYDSYLSWSHNKKQHNVGSRLSWMEGFKTIFFTLNHFWTVFLGSFQSFMGSIHRCTKRLGSQPLERLLRADIFASRRRNTFPPKWGVLQSDELMHVLKSNVKHSESSGLSWTWITTKPGSKFNIGNFQRLELCRPPHLLWGLGITPGKAQKTRRGILELPLTH